jgi:hypothetical protein
LRWDDLCQVSLSIGDRVQGLKTKSKLRHLKDAEVNLLSVIPDDPTEDLRRWDGTIGRLGVMHSAREKFRGYIGGIGVGNDLLATLASRRGMNASDARDMIYAHLGVHLILP